MKKRVISVFFVLPLCLFPYLGTSLKAESNFLSKIPELKAYIQKGMKDWEIPGLAITIVENGKIIYKDVFGVKDIKTRDPLNESTTFTAASLTKNIFVYLVAILVDKGFLKWDDPVKKYLPDFKIGDQETTNAFTLRDLISHRSGLDHFSGDTAWTLGFSALEIQQFLGKLPLSEPFRSQYGYQNNVFGLMSFIVEKVTKKSVSQLMSEYIFTPLGMKDSSIGYEKLEEEKSQGLFDFFLNLFKTPKKTNFSFSHHHIDGKVVSFKPLKGIYTYNGSTGLNISIHDAAQWLLFLLNQGKVPGAEKTLITSSNFLEPSKPHARALRLKDNDPQFPASHVRDVHYGMGNFIYQYGIGQKSFKVLTHMGGIAGWRSLIFQVPSEKFGVIILSNLGGFRESLFPEAIRYKICDLYLGLPEKDWNTQLLSQFQKTQKKYLDHVNAARLQNPLSPKEFSSYEGNFKNDLYGDLKVTLENDQLFIHYRGKKVILDHWNGDEFRFKSYELSPFYSGFDLGIVQFGKFEKGKAHLCYVNLMNEGSDPVFKRGE